MGGAGGGAPSLGLNDITWLTPLPAGKTPVLASAADLASDGKPLLSKALVTQVLTTPGMSTIGGDVYDVLHLVAARFDLCDREAAGACKDTDDARFRLVFQPLEGGQFDDFGLHVFYAVPRADVPKVVAALHELAMLQGEPVTAPLHVSKGISAGGAYVTKLKALLATYCSEATATRVTAMGQELTAAAFRWLFHGIEKKGGAFQEIPMTGFDATTQEALLLDISSFDVTPAVDTPKGFATAVDAMKFTKATMPEQITALDALEQIDNPLLSVPSNVSCVTCHVSTIVRAGRLANVDPKTLPSRFKSTFDTSVAAGKSEEDPDIIRGLGYRGFSLAISQRAANETAQAATEINARF
jgi:hypothetical protein